jgi:hypothetical protein
MPRYFFHFASRDDFIPDFDGVALEGLAAAHRHAVRPARQTRALLAAGEPRHWTIEIADERQRVVLTVLFPAAAPGGPAKDPDGGGRRPAPPLGPGQASRLDPPLTRWTSPSGSETNHA